MHIIIYMYWGMGKKWDQEMIFSQLVKQSPWWAAGNCRTCIPSGVQGITQKKIAIKLFLTEAIKQYQTQLFREFDAWTISKQTKLYWKKSDVKTESPLGKQQAREIWRPLDSEGVCLLFRPIKEQRVIIEMSPKMTSTCVKI